MHSFIQNIRSRLSRSRGLGGPQVHMSHHDALMLFWYRTVVGTSVALVCVLSISLLMWWVIPQDPTTEVLLPEEELPEQTSDGYDITRAEKVIQFYQNRQEKTEK